MPDKKQWTLEEIRQVVAERGPLSFDWKFPKDYGSAWIYYPQTVPNPDFDEEGAMRDPRTRVKINGIEVTPEFARKAWLLCIDPKYRHLA